MKIVLIRADASAAHDDDRVNYADADDYDCNCDDDYDDKLTMMMIGYNEDCSYSC